jgi:hypothetical protein
MSCNMSNCSSNRYSGEVLPLILREKLQQKSGAIDDYSSLAAGIDSCQPERARGLTVEDRNRKFTADELEDELWKMSQALVETQQQIVRGEEVYYEETQAYGSNLFRGWETFIDSRDVGNSNGTGVQGGGPRRVPNDFRWFSSSATSLSTRHLKPEPMGVGSRMSSTVTSAASTSDVSEAPAPTKSVVPSAPVSTKSDVAKMPRKDPSRSSTAEPPNTRQEPPPKVVVESSANVDSKEIEATESKKELSPHETMGEDTADEPEATDDSKRDKRKVPSDSADATKEGKDSAPRRTKRKRRSGAN